MKLLHLLLFTLLLLLSACLFNTESEDPGSNVVVDHNTPVNTDTTAIDTVPVGADTTGIDTVPVNPNTTTEDTLQQNGEKSVESKRKSGVSYMVVGEYGEGGQLRSVSLDSTFILSKSLIEIDQDSRIYTRGTDLYILERQVGNITKYNTTTASVTYQNSLAVNGNPYEIVFANDTIGYVVYYGLPYVVEMDLTSGIAVDSIDLSAYAVPGMTTPNAADLNLVDNLLYVSMQRFDTDWNPDTAKIAVIDINTNTIVNTITPQLKNPANTVIDGNDLYVASSGKYGLGEGGLEHIDLTTQVSTILINNEALGGDPSNSGSALVQKNATELFITISGGWPLTSVKLFDLTTQAIVKTYGTETEIGGGVYYHAGTDVLLFGEQKSTASGLVIYEADTLLAGPVGSTIPSPNAITVVFP
ncbi:MAG: hypothetical protein OCC49_03080 [Fibrobacterales bacterium]